MAIHCEFIDLIIPIANIDRVYPGGFAQFKKDHEQGFSGVLWHPEYAVGFLLRPEIAASASVSLAFLSSE